MSKSQNKPNLLERLFNSKVRVKILKFLFRNYPVNVGIWELSRRLQEPLEVIRKEVKDLEKIGLLAKNS